MPGFVDVGNMSDQDIKRMGQQDDDVNEQLRQGRRSYGAPARTNPVLQTGHSVSDVWAAACAAQRVNSEYVKEEQWMRNATPPYIAKRRNRDVMMDFLHGAETLTDEDRAAGEQCRTFLQSDLTFRALKGKLTEFDGAISKCLAVQDRFYTVSHRYELAVIAALPNFVRRTQTRQDSDQRIRFAQGGLIGKVGDKITVNIEVLSANYSQQFNTFWVCAVTDQDQPVMFGLKEKHDAGTHLSIQGKVKAHRDNLTQLNYVKVL